MIEIKGLSKRFGRKPVLKDLDLQIAGGGVFAILGPNGSGKSTLIKAILGLCIPEAGDIKIKGQSILRGHQYRKQIQYLPQMASFPANLRVSELLKMIQDLRPGARGEGELLSRFDLLEFLNAKLGTLSGGTRQKVNLLLCFMYPGEIIILDEPTNGLDPKSSIFLKELIRQEKEQGKTILITSHIMQFVEQMADELVYLLEGKIYYRGTPQALKERAQAVDFEAAIAHLTQ